SSEQNHIASADFGSFSLIAVLVVPLAGLQAAFDVNQPAFRQILVADFRKPVPSDDVMPFRALLTFAGSFIVPGIVSRHGKAAERNAAGGVFELRITTEPAHKNHFVHGFCHSKLLKLASSLAGRRPSR